MIQIDKLHKSYGEKTVLQQIDAIFSKGMIYGIVGHNGAGKTTLFKCIAGLESFSGSIQPVPTDLKNRLGYLDTYSYFLPKITGQEYLILLTEARGKKIKNLKERNIFDLPLNSYVSTYSSGMQKKLAITALLLQDNDYLILDEPYNGLDFQSAMLLSKIIIKLKTRNKTILISSHIFSTLEESSDQILLLEDGYIKRRVDKADFGSLNAELKERVSEIDIDKLLGD